MTWASGAMADNVVTRDAVSNVGWLPRIRSRQTGACDQDNCRQPGLWQTNVLSGVRSVWLWPMLALQIASGTRGVCGGVKLGSGACTFVTRAYCNRLHVHPLVSFTSCKHCMRAILSPHQDSLKDSAFRLCNTDCDCHCFTNREIICRLLKAWTNLHAMMHSDCLDQDLGLGPASHCKKRGAALASPCYLIMHPTSLVNSTNLPNHCRRACTRGRTTMPAQRATHGPRPT